MSGSKSKQPRSSESSEAAVPPASKKVKPTVKAPVKAAAVKPAVKPPRAVHPEYKRGYIAVGVYAHKGGVGKTELTYQLAYALAVRHLLISLELPLLTSTLIR
jgi:Mrp family chromosome partitioning ATPase